MAMHFRYRKNGGQIAGISTVDPFSDTTYFGNVTDPPTPDGTDLPPGTTTDGFDAVWDGTDVRNATQNEIDGFAAKIAEDDLLDDRFNAKNLLTAHPQWRKLLRALVLELLDEMENRDALIPTPRTLAEIRDAVFARIDGGSVD